MFYGTDENFQKTGQLTLDLHEQLLTPTFKQKYIFGFRMHA